MTIGGVRRQPPRTAAPGAALLAALLVAGCAAKPADPREPKVVREHAMSPYVIHEECLPAAVGDRIDYYFASTFPVDFNVHYHEAGAVVMPIVRDKSTGDSGVYVARIAHEYCLMWEAGPAGTSLDYRLRLRPPADPQ
jgi:hypothetical protein